MSLKTPKQITDEVFDKNWNGMTARQLMVAAIEADRAQREEEVSPPRPMGSGDLCWFGPEQYQVTHHRCDKYRDGTVTDTRTGRIVTYAPSFNRIGFQR